MCSSDLLSLAHISQRGKYAVREERAFTLTTSYEPSTQQLSFADCINLKFNTLAPPCSAMHARTISSARANASSAPRSREFITHLPLGFPRSAPKGDRSNFRLHHLSTSRSRTYINAGICAKLRTGPHNHEIPAAAQTRPLAPFQYRHSDSYHISFSR